jgi:quercetin dioxygenase-like cupin family protein
VLDKVAATEIEFSDGAPEKFFGAAKVHTVNQHFGTQQMEVRHVEFAAGARARPHTHGADQLLFFPTGGIVAIDGGPDEPVSPGQYVLLPGGRPHMHGAGDDAPASHISIMREIDYSDFSCPIDPSWQRYRL